MSQDTNQTRIFFGRLLCGLGIALAVIGAFFVSVATNVLGMVLGMGWAMPWARGASGR